MVFFPTLRVTLLLVSLLSRSTLAAPTGTVLTPGGYVPAANVHAVPEGGQVRHVNDEIHLIDKDGNVLQVVKNANPQPLSRTPTTSATEPVASGWVAYAGWVRPSSPINSFTASWIVPPTPSQYSGQTVYLFNSLEPANGLTILQPVLQYGPSEAGGGEFWTVASWYVTSDSAFFTPLVAVSVGQQLTGIVQLTGESGGSWSYSTQFTNVPGSGPLALVDSDELAWATLTLEIYNVESSNFLPPGTTEFFDIDITTTDGVPAVTWSTTSDPADGITATVTVQGATNAEVEITY